MAKRLLDDIERIKQLGCCDLQIDLSNQLTGFHALRGYLILILRRGVGLVQALVVPCKGSNRDAHHWSNHWSNH